ncbi:MAG TPA: hypothetical protein VI390_06740 [Methyloceanibacter sp.]
MSQCEATQQVDNVTPPRRGSIVALTVDSTARPYDITALAFGSTYRPGIKGDYVYLTLTAETNAVYYQFNSATANDLDDTAKVSAGGTLAFATTHAALLPAGQTIRLRIQRDVDKWIIVKAASTSGVLRMHASSPPNPNSI